MTSIASWSSFQCVVPQSHALPFVVMFCGSLPLTAFPPALFPGGSPTAEVPWAVPAPGCPSPCPHLPGQECQPSRAVPGAGLPGRTKRLQPPSDSRTLSPVPQPPPSRSNTVPCPCTSGQTATGPGSPPSAPAGEAGGRAVRLVCAQRTDGARHAPVLGLSPYVISEQARASRSRFVQRQKRS